MFSVVTPISDWLIVLGVFLAMGYLVHAVQQYRSGRVRIRFKDPVIGQDQVRSERHVILRQLNRQNFQQSKPDLRRLDDDFRRRELGVIASFPKRPQ